MDLANCLCKCNICGFMLPWDSRDDIHGTMWYCEECGELFCTKCFIDIHGIKRFATMMTFSDTIYCPECYDKYKEVIL